MATSCCHQILERRPSINTGSTVTRHIQEQMQLAVFSERNTCLNAASAAHRRGMCAANVCTDDELVELGRHRRHRCDLSGVRTMHGDSLDTCRPRSSSYRIHLTVTVRHMRNKEMLGDALTSSKQNWFYSSQTFVLLQLL